MLAVCAESCKLAAELIKKGEIVAFPTETVYGLGANAYDTDAVAKIFVAKNRPHDNPLIVHVATTEQVAEFAYVNEFARKTMETFLPGSLTVVLPKKSTIPSAVTAGFETVAVRIPLSKEARMFLSECSVPVCAPSANTSTRPSPTRAKDVFEDLQGKIPLILCGKDCDVGIESTVLDLTSDTPTILRPGVVTKSVLERGLGISVRDFSAENKKVNSPGLRYKHYAPSVPVLLNTNGDVVKVVEKIDELHKSYDKIALFADSDVCDRVMHKINGQELLIEVLPPTAEGVAERIFALFRDYEKRCQAIVMVFEDKSEFGRSVLNRLMKSCGSHTF